MRARSFARSAFSLVALLALVACGSFGFRQPQVTLESVHLGGLGLRGGTLLVDLQVDNPNRFALNADELRYDLAVRDAEAEPGDTTWLDFASGTYAEGFVVGAGETRTVKIPVEFSYSGLGGAASSILRSGTFTYRATGSVDVRTPFGSRAVPFTKRGMVTMTGGR